MQERCNSIANALELHLSCTKPSICSSKALLNKFPVHIHDILLQHASLTCYKYLCLMLFHFSISYPRYVLAQGQYSSKSFVKWLGKSFYTPHLMKLVRGYTGFILLYPPAEQSCRGVYWFHLVHLSVCEQNRVCSVSSTILAGSILYLHTLSSNFRKCVTCNSKFWQIQICNFDIAVFWLGIQYELLNSMGNHGARRASSEGMRSSCSS